MPRHLMSLGFKVIVIGGTDTTAVTIEWAMTLLLNHPEVLNKARIEINNHVGSDRLVNEADLPNLRYLQSIISETFRICPAAPMLIPHQSAHDTKIGGFDIPSGTIILVNAWAVHRDPSVWDDPGSFKTERFEGNRGSYCHLEWDGEHAQVMDLLNV
ncbi:hypothetical protein FXO37_25583 [Capsicum annuum]|nr:hypothetical protein FXO37_25583 [Capsicum annuum]